ncbi:hypothetical protein [Mycoplasma phage sp.]|uniref:Uncharacterized protein n=1 Tax=Mycoplasmopsis anatis 1340 TaxID=1034808 RepID=F9QDI6_9BACT|nr:hypothetical protein [Mycoplasmopsis anatis]QRI43886.1 hypothetical protein [Mycoplasma phage sp.]AWX70374.1 hypothetical protein DP067_03390 [Mycoplasmopsis anatis]EGS29202.1 hypothetical protein GIG_02468 [Mycoplasmopsis anatis 1340]QRI43945.1 hypothetical protein [Mycoplasma phage sp.]QRI43980.1 hypothetical protein [Mycoplasma phage sp.]
MNKITLSGYLAIEPIRSSTGRSNYFSTILVTDDKPEQFIKIKIPQKFENLIVHLKKGMWIMLEGGLITYKFKNNNHYHILANLIKIPPRVKNYEPVIKQNLSYEEAYENENFEDLTYDEPLYDNGDKPIILNNLPRKEEKNDLNEYELASNLSVENYYYFLINGNTILDDNEVKNKLNKCSEIIKFPRIINLIMLYSYFTNNKNIDLEQTLEIVNYLNKHTYHQTESEFEEKLDQKFKNNIHLIDGHLAVYNLKNQNKKTKEKDE